MRVHLCTTEKGVVHSQHIHYGENANSDTICSATRGPNMWSTTSPTESSPTSTIGEPQTRRIAYQKAGREKRPSSWWRLRRRDSAPDGGQPLELPMVANVGRRLAQRGSDTMSCHEASSTAQLLTQLVAPTYSRSRRSAPPSRSSIMAGTIYTKALGRTTTIQGLRALLGQSVPCSTSRAPFHMCTITTSPRRVDYCAKPRPRRALGRRSRRCIV